MIQLQIVSRRCHPRFFGGAKKNSPASRGVELFDRVEQNGGSAEGGKDPTSEWFNQPAGQVNYFHNGFSNLSDKW